MNSSKTRITGPMSARGFSLVELMIGMTLGLILLLGVTSVLISNQRTYATEDNLSRVQESARQAYDFIARDVRMAGYIGCLSDVTQFINTLNTPNDFDWDFGHAIVGHEAVGTNWSPELPGVLAGRPLAGTDVITLRGAYGENTTLEREMPDTSADLKTTAMDPPPLETDDIVILSDCRAAAVFQVTNYTDANGNVVHNTGTGTPGNATKNFNHRFPPGSQVIKIKTTSYYVGTGASGQPALFRRDGGSDPEELVEGIENMQVEYGEDADGDRDADAYRKAKDVTDWNRVVSTRISLLVRGRDANALDASQPYTYDGQTVTPTDRRMRRVATYVVTLRNKTQ
ncbi:MAG: PilW family protein [Pseudomonadota bacterium]